MRKVTRKIAILALVVTLIASLALAAPVPDDDVEEVIFTVGGITYKVLTDDDSINAVQVGTGSYETPAVSLATTSLFIPSSVAYDGVVYKVASIGDYAFFDCKLLADIRIPRSVTIIGGDAFARCSSLKVVALPEFVTEIGVGAFTRCTNLTTVVIPSQVKVISEIMFFECPRLAEIYFDGDAPTIDLFAFLKTPRNVVAYVLRSAAGFPREGERWNRLIVRYRTKITHLSTGIVTHLVTEYPANLPIKVDGEAISGKQVVFSLRDSNGEVKYKSSPTTITLPYDTIKNIPASELSIPVGFYTFEAEVVGEKFTEKVMDLEIAPNLKDYWSVNLMMGEYDGVAMPEARFSNVDYIRTFSDEIFVNGLQQKNVIIDGDSVYLPGAPMSGTVTVELKGVKYPQLYPSYKFTFKATAEL